MPTMIGRSLSSLLLGSGLLLVAATSAGAQSHGPGVPPPRPAPPPPTSGPGGNPPPAHGADSSGSSTSSSNTGSSGANLRPSLPFGPAGRWWDDKGVASSIGLRRDQQRKMDGIFDANKDAIVASYKALEAQKAKLDQLTKSTRIDQAQVFAQIDAVSQARTALQKTTTRTMLQIRQLLDAEQVGKLEKLR